MTKANQFFIHTSHPVQDTGVLTQKDMGENDFHLKFLPVGAPGVGASSLILRYADDTFTTSRIRSLGVDFKIRTLEIQGKTVKTQIWDKPPLGSYGELKNIRGGHVMLIALDLTNKESYNQLDNWYQQIERSASEKAIIILVGTKSDSQNCVVTNDDIHTWISQHPRVSGYIATSSKNAINIDLVFEKAAELYIERNEQEKLFAYKQKVVQKIGELQHTDPLKYSLTNKLQQYIDRIETYESTTKAGIDFSRHFLFFKESQGANREANYLLAKHLLKELIDTSHSVVDIFNDIDTTRNNLAGESHLFNKPGYPNRGINSNELLKIINEANGTQESCLHLYNPFK